MRERYRVAVYVLDRSAADGQARVLCFDHVELPQAGTQIPAGGVADGETVEAAAAREVWEETGVRLGRARTLGVQQIEDRRAGVRKVTTFLAAAAVDPPARRWRHTVPSSGGEDSGLVFECFFLPLEEASAALTIDRQAEFLPRISGAWWMTDQG
jgi:8-oxo-dGTP pyrophosphatase MutT (NUDIX family)